MKLSNSQITIIHDWYLEKKTSISALQRATGINRTTIATYCKRFDQVKSEFPKRKKFRLTDYREKKREKPPTPNYMALQSMFLPLLANSEVRKNTPRYVYRLPGAASGWVYLQWL